MKLPSTDIHNEQKSSNEPKISVILPTYNRCERLRKCLPSFLKTSVQQVEFIIVDNCSTDDTWSFLQEISKKNNRVRIIKNPQNVGAIKTIFRAYCEVRTPFVVFLADDDTMVGDYIAKCLEIFENYPDVGIVHHLNDGWQKSAERYKNSFTIYSAGDDAVKKVFMLSGSYPGIAFRMADFNLRDFPLGDDVIYPQVKVSLEMASKTSLAIINDCGLVSEDFGDSVLDYKSFQNRPDDMGIGERLSYASFRESPLLTQDLALQISTWAGGLFNLFEKIDENSAKRFVKSLAPNLNIVTPAFILYLLKRKKLKYALASILRLILTPVFIKYYIYFLVFFLKKKQ